MSSSIRPPMPICIPSLSQFVWRHKEDGSPFCICACPSTTQERLFPPESRLFESVLVTMSSHMSHVTHIHRFDFIFWETGSECWNSQQIASPCPAINFIFFSSKIFNHKHRLKAKKAIEFRMFSWKSSCNVEEKRLRTSTSWVPRKLKAESINMEEN